MQNLCDTTKPQLVKVRAFFMFYSMVRKEGASEF